MKRYSPEWHERRKQELEDMARFAERRKSTPFVVMSHGFNAFCDSREAAEELVQQTPPEHGATIFMRLDLVDAPNREA